MKQHWLIPIGLGAVAGLCTLALPSHSAGGAVTQESRSGATASTRPATAAADQSATTRPARSDEDEAQGVAERVGGSMGTRLGDRLRGRGDDRDAQRSRGPRNGERDGEREDERREPTAQEWEQTLRFLAAHGPRRLEMYERFEEWARRRQEEADPERDGERRRDPEAMIRGVRSRIYDRVHTLQQLADRDPELHTFALRQFELEDEIYGIMAEVRRAREMGDDEALEEAQARARDAMVRYARNTFAERESRIQRLRQELEHEESRLERDRHNIDEIVRRLERRFGDPGPPEGRRRSGDRGEGRDAREGREGRDAGDNP